MCYIDINPNLTEHESKERACTFLKEMFCRNLEIPYHLPGYQAYLDYSSGIEYPIQYKQLKIFLDLINSIDINSCTRIGYKSLRNVGTFDWDDARDGTYTCQLGCLGQNILTKPTKNKYMLTYLCINIWSCCDSVRICSAIYDTSTQKNIYKNFTDVQEFISYYNKVIR